MIKRKKKSLQFLLRKIYIYCGSSMYRYSSLFLSHKINFVTLCFCPFYKKNFFFFFEKPRNFQFFMCFGPRRSFYEKSSGVWRPASCGQNLHVEKFQLQIISKPFDRSPSYLVWWCKKIIDMIHFSMTLTQGQRSNFKVKQEVN